MVGLAEHRGRLTWMESNVCWLDELDLLVKNPLSLVLLQLLILAVLDALTV